MKRKVLVRFWWSCGRTRGRRLVDCVTAANNSQVESSQIETVDCLAKATTDTDAGLLLLAPCWTTLAGWAGLGWSAPAQTLSLSLSLSLSSLSLLFLLLPSFRVSFYIVGTSTDSRVRMQPATPLQTTTCILIKNREKKNIRERERERLHACLYLCVYRLCVSTIQERLFCGDIYCGL